MAVMRGLEQSRQFQITVKFLSSLFLKGIWPQMTQEFEGLS